MGKKGVHCWNVSVVLSFFLYCKTFKLTIFIWRGFARILTQGRWLRISILILCKALTRIWWNPGFHDHLLESAPEVRAHLQINLTRRRLTLMAAEMLRPEYCPLAILLESPFPFSGQRMENTQWTQCSFLELFPAHDEERIMMTCLYKLAFSGVKRVLRNMLPMSHESLHFILVTPRWRVINGNYTSSWSTHCQYWECHNLGKQSVTVTAKTSWALTMGISYLHFLLKEGTRVAQLLLPDLCPLHWSTGSLCWRSQRLWNLEYSKFLPCEGS